MAHNFNKHMFFRHKQINIWEFRMSVSLSDLSQSNDIKSNLILSFIEI